MSTGGHLFLATNDQKGRILKVSSWDAYFPLLTEWVGLVFLEVWLMFHAHAGKMLFWRICPPQTFSFYIFKIMPLGWPTDDFSPHSPKLPGVFLLKDPRNRFLEGVREESWTKSWKKIFEPYPSCQVDNKPSYCPNGEGKVGYIFPGSSWPCQCLPVLRDRLASTSVVLSSLSETPSKCVS